MVEQQCLACGLQKTVCARARVYLRARPVRSHTYTKKKPIILPAYLFLRCEQGSSVASGQNFKNITCAKNVDMKKQPTGARHAQQSARNAHMCAQGPTKSQTSAMEGWARRHAEARCGGTM